MSSFPPTVSPRITEVTSGGWMTLSLVVVRPCSDEGGMVMGVAVFGLSSGG